MNLKIGIVGLPNAGKSTLFNALLKKTIADAQPYPFCTIEPNIGIVPVPDERLSKLAEITKIEEKLDSIPPLVPAIVEFVDIAGLVKGASKGEGLGNKFLAHIREVTVIVNVVREFQDENVMHVTGSLDPIRDKEIIQTELILADLQTLDKQSEPRGVKDHDAQKKWEVIIKLKDGLNKNIPARQLIVDPAEMFLIKDLNLLTIKPIITVINVHEDEVATFAKNHENLTANFPNALIVSAKIEAELAAMSQEDQAEYLASLGLPSSGLDRLIQKAYETLGLISFLTCGKIEVRAWTIYNGMSAQEASGVIHTDFIKKFIKAEVIGYDDFIFCGGKKGAKEKGKARLEGKEYLVCDGDVIEFKIGS